MVRKDDVEQFLNQFKVKLKVFDVVYIGRDKNAQTLLYLELIPSERTKILEQLEVKDYSEGPLEETMHGTGDMWVFGREIAGYEVYIKVAIGQPGHSVVCISFHKTEYPLEYPFKR